MANANNLTTQKTVLSPIGTVATTETSATYNPGQPSNLNSTGVNKTTNFFSNFFTPEQTVSANVDDAIIGYFQEQTGDLTAGKLLASAVINTALQQKEDPMTVLDQFKKVPIGELDVYLALYLNLSRVNTSLIGIRNTPQTNKYVQRSIVS